LVKKVPLIPCPDCDTQCSTTAVSCPKCGYRFGKKINLAGGLSALGSLGNSIKDKVKTKPKEYTFPLSVGKHFTLSKDSIKYKGDLYELPEDVCRLRIINCSTSVNFIPVGSSAGLNLELADGKKISVVQSGNLGGRENRMKAILAASYISKVTHRSRYNRYLAKLTENKQLTVEGITIHSDGHISKGRKRINLVESYEKGYIAEGVEFGSIGIGYSSRKPSALWIGANSLKNFSKKIIVEFKYDPDVLNQLILDIAKNPIH